MIAIGKNLVPPILLGAVVRVVWRILAHRRKVYSTARLADTNALRDEASLK
jgi:hypothetical protein